MQVFIESYSPHCFAGSAVVIEVVGQICLAADQADLKLSLTVNC